MQRNPFLFLLPQPIGFVMIDPTELYGCEHAVVAAVTRTKFKRSPPTFDDDG